MGYALGLDFHDSLICKKGLERVYKVTFVGNKEKINHAPRLSSPGRVNFKRSERFQFVIIWLF